MYELATLARPYAKACFEHGVANKALTKWQDLFRRLLFVIQDAKIAKYLANPLVNAEQKVEALLELINEDVWREPAKKFLKQLAVNRRLACLPAVVSQFEELLQNARQEKTAVIESAYALTDIEREKVAKTLSEKFECKIQIKTAINNDLIGGLVIKVGDRVIDASVKGHLEKLAASLI